ncbi:ATP-dependent nuclease [Alcanivorax profundi]|uniref:ATP-dependent nuclease n=1 Tax=Alcanivorax profundi TaxID=2338368 RepID=UPI0032B211F7|tara:strand:+ start:2815 stop:4743 length:1929 start_codon:yes stop_codon:yes gene_type:complete
MKISSIRIENFRAFNDETVQFDDYSCFVGPNGAGKSTILAALNVFFRQYKDSKTDLSKLSAEDFHHKNINLPIRITVTFSDLSDEAKHDLSDYVRQEKLVVSAVAKYNPSLERAEVKQYGNRLGIEAFRKYFDAEKQGKSVADLKVIYAELKSQHPDLKNATTKAAMIEGLQEYESSNSDSCVLIPSEDQFYGASRGTNRLSRHLQWVFVPAVKDITEESQESKTSGLGQLLQRTIRSKVDFANQVSNLRNSLSVDYQKMLDSQQSALDELSNSLEIKLKDWAHPAVSAKVLWKQDSEKSIKVEEPWAYIEIGERGFEGELARFGHGMQRSFMLSLLQELSTSLGEESSTLIFAIEEPELYQHPPQARYLAEVLHNLAISGSQIMVCSHSPLFIPGNDFETVRVVRENGNPPRSNVFKLSYQKLSKTLSDAGQNLLTESGMLAKLYPSLCPSINEMFFCKVLVLVEGIEDVAHIQTYMSLLDFMGDYRKFGCHIVPAGGKSEIIKPLAMAKQLRIPVFVVCDADTDTELEGHINKHKKDNASILKLIGKSEISNWPRYDIWTNDIIMWKTNLTKVVHSEIGENWKMHIDKAAEYYGQPGGLRKNPLAVSRALKEAWEAGEKSQSLIRLSKEIIKFSNIVSID